MNMNSSVEINGTLVTDAIAVTDTNAAQCERAPSFQKKN